MAALNVQGSTSSWLLCGSFGFGLRLRQCTSLRLRLRTGLGLGFGLRGWVWAGGFQAPFPPAVTHSLLLIALAAAIG